MANLIIITGQEGAGKSTICRALLPQIPQAAQIDAEDVGQVNPWEMNEAFIQLLWKNVLALTNNFIAAGYTNIIAASFLSSYEELQRFRQLLPKPDELNIYVIQLTASKEVRDQRRVERSKPTTKEWRDTGDAKYPEDITLQDHAAEYRFLKIDTSDLTTDEVVIKIKQEFLELFSQEI